MSSKTNVLKAYPNARIIGTIQIETGKIKFFIRVKRMRREVRWKITRCVRDETLGSGNTSTLAWSEAWKTVQKEILEKFEQ